MHVVTKILLVFCAVLSLLLAALTMAYAANAGEIRNGYRAMEQEKLAAIAAEADLRSQWAFAMAESDAKTKAARDKVDALEKEKADLQAQRTELRTQLEQAKAETQAIANRIVELVGTVGTQAEVLRVSNDELTRLRDDMMKSSRREIELVDHINDLEGQREVLDQTARALQEQVKESQLALQAAQAGDRVGTDATQPYESTGPLILARVLDVFKSPAGEDMVVISEGSNRGVKQNMLMSVKRGDSFLAKLVIVSVEPNRAVGKIDKLGRDVAIQSNDQVLSSLLR